MGTEFTNCSECGKKLHSTFYCLECGQPTCSLECYRRHETNHVVGAGGGKGPSSQAKLASGGEQLIANGQVDDN
jgi:hypothetical protein